MSVLDPYFRYFSLFAATSALASPLVEIGDSASIVSTLAATGEFRSNVTLSAEDEIDDFVWTLTPGLEFNYGTPGATLDFSMFAQYGLVRFVDSSEFDTERANIGVILDYDGDRYTVSGSAGYRESEDFESDAIRGREVVEIADVYGTINTRYQISPKTGIGLGGSYTDREYENSQFNRDRIFWNVPVTLFREVTPKYDALVEFEFGQTDIDEGDLYSDSALNVGLDGEVLPKLDGTFKVGYRNREFDSDRDSEAGINLNLGGNYQISQVSEARFSIFSRFGAGGGGASNEQIGGSLTYFRQISRQIRGTAFARYTMIDYTESDREDDNINLALSGEYTFNQFVSFRAGYTFRYNDSSFDLQDYESHYLSATIAVRY